MMRVRNLLDLARLPWDHGVVAAVWVQLGAVVVLAFAFAVGQSPTDYVVTIARSIPHLIFHMTVTQVEHKRSC